MRIIRMAMIFGTLFAISFPASARMMSPEMVARMRCAKDRNLKNDELKKCIEIQTEKIKKEQKELRDRMRKRGIAI